MTFEPDPRYPGLLMVDGEMLVDGRPLIGSDGETVSIVTGYPETTQTLTFVWLDQFTTWVPHWFVPMKDQPVADPYAVTAYPTTATKAPDRPL